MLGVEWNKPIFITFVRTGKFTHELLMKNPQFTVNIPQGKRPQDIISYLGNPAGLVGKQEEEARKLLTETGFTNIQTLAAPATNDTVNAKKGKVVEVVPGEGEQASTDQQVTLYVTSGRTQTRASTTFRTA